jgi:hypothetical protein
VWFVTWDRPDYREWARTSDEGYQLLVVRPEADGQRLVARARLVMTPVGLPEFVLEESERVATDAAADALLARWRE